MRDNEIKVEKVSDKSDKIADTVIDEIRASLRDEDLSEIRRAGQKWVDLHNSWGNPMGSGKVLDRSE